MLNKKYISIPNLLTFYRIFSFPFILSFAIIGKEQLFVIMLVINLITDILDGWIARKFNLQTEFGARIDSIADVGTYILAVTGIFLFKADEIAPHLTSFLLFISLFVTSNILSLIKFKRFPSLHLYSWKIGGYIQGLFFFVLFVFDFYTFLYYLMITWGIMAFCEHIVIQLIINEMQSNLKGLYWILRKKNKV